MRKPVKQLAVIMLSFCWPCRRRRKISEYRGFGGGKQRTRGECAGKIGTQRQRRTARYPQRISAFFPSRIVAVFSWSSGGRHPVTSIGSVLSLTPKGMC